MGLSPGLQLAPLHPRFCCCYCPKMLLNSGPDSKTEGCTGPRFGSGGYRGSETKLKARRNQSPKIKAAALMQRAAHFTPCCLPVLLLPRAGHPQFPWGGGGQEHHQHRGETALSGCLAFPALSYKRASKPKPLFCLESQHSHLLMPFRDIQHLPEFPCCTTASPLTAYICILQHKGLS